MLVIREEQLHALAGARLDRFARGLTRSLIDAFPRRFATSDDARAFVDRSIAVAFEHGIDLADSLAAFARLRAAYGEDFEWTPVAQAALALLHDSSLPAAIKVAAMVDCLDTATGGRPVTLAPEGDT